jgi:hypothetical protein
VFHNRSLESSSQESIKTSADNSGLDDFFVVFTHAPRHAHQTSFCIVRELTLRAWLSCSAVPRMGIDEKNCVLTNNNC